MLVRGGPTDSSMGLLVGRACLSGTTKTLVGGDPVSDILPGYPCKEG
jgi:hypothetical protein